MSQSKDDVIHVMAYRDGALRPTAVRLRKAPPSQCGFSTEDLDCLGCGVKLGCVKPGHCYAVEGKRALRSH